MKRRSLLITCVVGLTLGIAVAVWSANATKGRQLPQLSERAQTFLSAQKTQTGSTLGTAQFEAVELNPENQRMTTECFSLALPTEFQYPKTSSDETSCMIRVTLVEPRGKIVVQSRMYQDFAKLEDMPDVKLRESQADVYTPVTIPAFPDALVYQTQSELTAFVGAFPHIVTFSISDLPRVTPEVQTMLEDMLASLELTPQPLSKEETSDQAVENVPESTVY